MTDLDDRAPPFSRRAVGLFRLLQERGGTMRLAPLRDAARLSDADLAATLTELVDRHWITLTWRRDSTPAPADAPRPLHDITRITGTRFGRWRERFTWAWE